MMVVDPTASAWAQAKQRSRGVGGGLAVLVAKQSSFGARLKELREKAGHTKYALAQLSGVSQQTIAQLEKPGGGDPSWETVKKLAHALGVSIDEFDDKKEDEPAEEKPAPKPKKPKPR